MLEAAIKQAIDAGSMLYNHKQNCPDDQRDRELRFIYHLAELAPDGPAIECGIYRAGTLLCWSEARHGRGLILANDMVIPLEAYHNIASCSMPVELLVMPSYEVRLREQVAFCFIDADHSEEGIRKDVAIWPSQIKPGGILAFHDYGSDHEPIIKTVIDEWQEKTKWEMVGQVGTLIAFRRPHETA